MKGVLSEIRFTSSFRLHPSSFPRAGGALVGCYLPEEYVAELLARHVEVHEELLAARRDLHVVEHRALVGAAAHEAARVDEHAVAARHLGGAHVARRVRRGL